MNRKPLLEKRLSAIKSAMALTTDDAVITPYRLQALTLVEQLVVALNALQMYDKEITALAFNQADRWVDGTPYLDLVYSISTDYWRGTKTVNLKVQDFQPSAG